MDNLCDIYGHIDVRKIDVEGFELHVPRGLTKVFARIACVFHE